MAADLIDHREPFREACARRSREAGALSEHARTIADWLDEHIPAATDTKLNRSRRDDLRDDLRRASHNLDDISQGLRDLARDIPSL